MRLGVLNNFGAGGGGNRQEQVKAFLHKHPDVASEVPSGGDDVASALGRLGSAGVDVLAVNGGDGTLQNVLTHLLTDESLFERLPVVLPLRSGRTNMSALDIGSQRSPMKSLDAALRATRYNKISSHLVPRAVLRVDLGPEHGVQFGMFCGIGMIHRAINWTHQLFPYGRSQGVFGSGIVTGSLVLRHFFGRTEDGESAAILEPDTVDVCLDGDPLAAKEFRLMIASTLDRLFLRMRPFWGEEKAPVRFTALEPSAMDKHRRIYRILRGRRPFVRGDSNREGYFSRNVDEAVLTMDCGLTIDGEIFDPEPQHRIVMTGDRRIRFMRA